MFLFRSPLRLTARCVLYYNTSWQGDPLRVPVASPRLLVLLGVDPFAPSKRFAVLSRAGRDFALLLHLHRPRGLRSPMDPSIKGEKLALPSEHPINQPYAGWMSAIVSPVGSRPACRLLDFEQGFRPPAPRPRKPSLDADNRARLLSST